MSLYRTAGRPRPARLVALGAAALVAGLAIGFAIGRSSAPEPTLAEKIAELREQLRPAANALELIPGEYAQAHRGEGAEATGVSGLAARLREDLAGTRADLEALDPGATRKLTSRVAALDRGVREKRPPTEVRRLAAAAAAALEATPVGP